MARSLGNVGSGGASPHYLQKLLLESKEMETFTHRVAIMETRQVIMDIEAPNDVESIKEVALSAYFHGEGDQEVGLTMPNSLVIYPWLEEGQTPPVGSAYPNPTEVELEPLTSAMHSTFGALIEE